MPASVQARLLRTSTAAAACPRLMLRTAAPMQQNFKHQEQLGSEPTIRQRAMTMNPRLDKMRLVSKPSKAARIGSIQLSSNLGAAQLRVTSRVRDIHEFVCISAYVSENRKRTIVLGGLPGTAGFTFVQSLIHGGSIETMKLSSSNSAGTATAFITFTSGDACDRYFAKYPNGIGVRHEGKKHIIFVDKSDRVDIMSSIVQGYLDCGASRVVKATGADEDWGIMALNRLAEGKNKTRAVEAVTDSLQDGVSERNYAPLIIDGVLN